eukprot:m.236586 g.236586  ORF g.236586 m.236586 type:complete len:575 (+) comp20674_c0_seq1:1616-3340(+)
MPEGPEIRWMSELINKLANHGTARFSHISRSVLATHERKHPPIDLPSSWAGFTVRARPRGKELQVVLQGISPALTKRKTWPAESAPSRATITLLFRAGMSGNFMLKEAGEEFPKHAHLRLHIADTDTAVCFVDPRRFGSWQVSEEWGPPSERGPDILEEPALFIQNVQSQLTHRAFDGAIAEVLLDQQFFNGIGNYLRAEILHRANISPFVRARDVLSATSTPDQSLTKEEEEEEVEEHPFESLGNQLASSVLSAFPNAAAMLARLSAKKRIKEEEQGKESEEKKEETKKEGEGEGDKDDDTKAPKSRKRKSKAATRAVKEEKEEAVISPPAISTADASQSTSASSEDLPAAGSTAGRLYATCIQVLAESLAVLRVHGFHDDSARSKAASAIDTTVPTFNAWLRCYTKLADAVDGIGRRVWFAPHHRGVKSLTKTLTKKRSAQSETEAKQEEGEVEGDDVTGGAKGKKVKLTKKKSSKSETSGTRARRPSRGTSKQMEDGDGVAAPAAPAACAHEVSDSDAKPRVKRARSAAGKHPKIKDEPSSPSPAAVDAEMAAVRAASRAALGLRKVKSVA